MRRKDPSEKHTVLSTSVLPAVAAEVRRMASARHVPPSQVIREALDAYLEATPADGTGRSARGDRRGAGASVTSLPTKAEVARALGEPDILKQVAELLERRWRDSNPLRRAA